MVNIAVHMKQMRVYPDLQLTKYHISHVSNEEPMRYVLVMGDRYYIIVLSLDVHLTFEWTGYVTCDDGQALKFTFIKRVITYQYPGTQYVSSSTRE